MTTIDQFLKALAVVESSDNPEAWGDAGRAMGRWQVHPDRLWFEMQRLKIEPKLDETWDQLVARVVTAIAREGMGNYLPVEVSMYWHKQFWGGALDERWDAKYAARFGAALANAQEKMP